MAPVVIAVIIFREPIADDLQKMALHCGVVNDNVYGWARCDIRLVTIILSFMATRGYILINTCAPLPPNGLQWCYCALDHASH